MEKRTIILLAALTALTAFLQAGCQRAKASGKLQIMYSGNIRGNIAPCG